MKNSLDRKINKIAGDYKKELDAWVKKTLSPWKHDVAAGGSIISIALILELAAVVAATAKIGKGLEIDAQALVDAIQATITKQVAT